MDELPKFNYISVTNVAVDKRGKPAGYDVFDGAWGTLFQRFENTLRNGNFPGAYANDMGIVITDATAGTKLMRKVRKMAVHNPIPNMQQFGPGYINIPIVKIIEDPSERDSKDSYPIQACDVNAYFLTQYFIPNAYIIRKRAAQYFQRISPFLNTRASTRNKLGIVIL